MPKTLRKTTELGAFDYLLATNQITQADLNDAVVEASRGRADLEALLIEKYNIPKGELGASLSQFYQCPYIGYNERMLPDLELLKNLSVDYLKKNCWIPLKREHKILDILIDDPHDIDKGTDIRRAFPGLTIRLAVGLRRDILKFLGAATGHEDGSSITEILGELVNEAQQDQPLDIANGPIDENDSAIVRLANQIIADAYRLDVSDIHIEPYSDKKETVVRFRVDGTCFKYMTIPASYRRAIVSRLKIMANLDIAERRKPQDGKIRYKLGRDNEVELRVATIPTAGHNEDVAMRVLTAREPMPLEAMEFSRRSLELLKRVVEKPYGIILCVGPTGSGKTTTLHALLNSINTDERKIWTAEDPIEITQDGLRQVQVHPKIGFTFAAALRAFLRADPDVIMIGEMRDKETADIAIEASLTGHLVLSTLHTNSSVETVTRLLDLGCDSFNFADAMLGIIAKRLCKRICQSCKEPYQPSKQEYEELVHGYGAEYWKRTGIEYDTALKLYRGKGCETCNHAGYKGRIALHEILLGTEEMKTMIQANARTKALFKQALDDGMTTLVQDGIEKVLQGHTTYKQVKSVAIK
jgi:type II secretory ATPase GspE/PulE/Tfp pilus assembly ATPase PilB-like protein